MWFYWFFPISFTVIIFSTLSWVADWQRALFSRVSPADFALALKVVLSLLLLVLVCRFVIREKTNRLKRILWFLAVAGGFGLALKSIPLVVEQVHLVEYGLLAWLFYRPLKKMMGDPSALLMAWLITFAVGIVDESIQYILPTRVGVLPDIYLNGLSAALSLLLIGKVLHPVNPGSKISSANTRSVCTAALGVLALLAWFVPTVSDWGYRHQDPGIGEFKSHFSTEHLQIRDRLEAEKNAAFVKELMPHKIHNYLKKQEEVDPYFMELGLHLVRRDQFEGKGQLWKAYKENQILAQYFPESLKATGYAWTHEKSARIGQSLPNPSKSLYKSPVAREQIIAAISPLTFWLGLSFLWLTLFWVAAKQK